MDCIASIESLNHDGRGVAHPDGKTVFIEGALPGETVIYSTFKKKDHYEQAATIRVLKESAARVTPPCRHFGVCGGCSMQHVDPAVQVAAKQRVLEDNLWHLGKVRPAAMLPAIYGPDWGYRHRARLSVKHVLKKNGVLVGFHEKRSTFIADMHGCKVLPARISALIDPLRELIVQLSVHARLPQVEIALGQDVDVLVLRILDPLTEQDESLLKTFADRYQVCLFLQEKGQPDSAVRFYPADAPELNYTLPEFDIVMPFHPTEFTQVNPDVNRMLVRRALSLLAPRPGERIADLFCGLGNFTLPIARSGASVLGVEGSHGLVRRATENAARNGLSTRASFLAVDLFQISGALPAEWGHFDKMLIDPPRDGAVEIVKALDEHAPSRIVYVSCSPSTLARDASILVYEKGYTLAAAGIVNMFPHTAHVESIALFEKP